MQIRLCASLLAIGLLVLLAACGGIAPSPGATTTIPARPTIVPTPAASMRAAVPRTNAPTTIPRAAPTTTPTAAPTEQATTAPDVATPIVLDQFVDVWTRFSSADGAPIYLSFSDNGTFRGSIGPDYASSATSFKGAYELTDGTLLVTGAGGDCGDDVGTYHLELLGDGQYLFFDPVDEPCSDRGFDGRWSRYLP